MNDPRDLDIERFLAGDPRQVAELPARLGSDPELRRRLGAALLQDALLRQALQTMPAAARRREPRRAMPWLMAAGILLAIAAGLWFMVGQPPAAAGPIPVIQVVAARDAALDGRPLQAGDPVPGGTLATGSSGEADLRLGQGDRIALAGSSRLQVVAVDDLRLTAGNAACAITRHEPDAPFAIAMPGAVAIAVGTRFTVAVPAAVAVSDGQVALLTAAGDAGVLVGTGGSAALADSASWYRFPDEDLLALPPAELDRACLLLSARRRIVASAPVRLIVVQGALAAGDGDRAALALRVAQRCVAMRLPVEVVLGSSRDLERRIQAGGLDQLTQLLDTLLRLDPAVTVRVSSGMEKGTSRTAADAITGLDERCRAVRGQRR